MNFDKLRESLKLEPLFQENFERKYYACKGLFWRASVNSYLSSHRSIEYRESLRFLKRMSCKGCETCDWVWDALQEEIELNGGYPGDIEHGKIYTYNVVTSQGYYDLYPEIDYIEFVEVKDKDKENVR